MSLTTITDLFESTTFERLALQSPEPAQGSTTMDLRGEGPPHVLVSVTSIVSISEGPASEFYRKLGPLLFGAAWKCLDLIFEYGLSSAGVPRRGKTYSIDQKISDGLRGNVAPLTSDIALWNRLHKVYALTAEVRHCVIHRSFSLDATTGAMTRMNDRNGSAVPDVSTHEQQAIGHLALHALDAIAVGQLNVRRRSSIAYWLDQLNRLHTLGSLGGVRAHTIPTVIVRATRRADGVWTVDTARAKQLSQATWRTLSFFDARIEFGDSGVTPLIGRLDEAPSDAALEIDPARPPAWTIP